MTLHIFNPEHDIALASGLANFTAPHAGRVLRHDLAFLPALWAELGDAVLVDDVEAAARQAGRLKVASKVMFVTRQQLAHIHIDHVEPWGWDSALRAFLIRCGLDSTILPGETTLDDIRELSRRSVAAWLLPQLRSDGTVGEMSPDGTRPIGQPVIVFDGNGTENRTCEGPKFYKRDGWYWILCPAGGVPTGFQLAMRSKSPFGPYEHKIVLAQGKTNINGPHQGGWVHTKYGEDWFLHFQDKEAYGRVVHLNPVDWSSGWPVMGKKGEPVTTFRKPQASSTRIVNPVESDEFDSPTIGKQWQWQANYDEKYGMPTAFGTFRIYTYKLSEGWKNFWEVPNMLLQKTSADRFTVTTKLRFTSKADGQMGGLIMMGLDYSALMVRRTGNVFQLVQATCQAADKGKPQTENVIATLKPTAKDKIDYKPGIHEDIYLRMTVADSKLRFAYSTNGKQFTACGTKFKMREGKWIGAKFGFVSVETDPKADRGWVEADWLRVTK